MKKIAIGASILALTLSLTFAVSASSFEMDNDALSDSGSTNPVKTASGLGWHDMTWISDSRCKNGDTRRGACTSSARSSEYFWRTDIFSIGQEVSVYAYLNHPTFNDTAATYDYQEDFGYYRINGSFNQNTAPVGYNYLGKAKSTHYNGVTIVVGSSSNSGKYLGADTIRLDY